MQPHQTVCLTKGCVNAASELIQSIDESVDPCSNFYQFVCGNYMKEAKIPDHKSDTGTFSLVADQLNKRLRQIFESAPAAKDPKAYQNVRNIYQSCMDTEDIRKNSISELMEIINDLGGWPVLQGDRWDGGGFQWLDFAESSWKRGFNFDGLLAIKIVTDAKDATKRRLQIDQPNLGLSREYLVKGVENKGVKAYLKYMVDIAVLLGASEESAKQDMKEALDLEIEVAKITLPREERRNKTALYNLMTIKDITALYPLPWGKHLYEYDLVNVAAPEYLNSVKTLLSSTPTRTIANLMMWRNVQYSVDLLTLKAGDIKLEFDEVIEGQASKVPRWEMCAKKTAGIGGNGELEEKYYFYNAEGSLTNAVGAMYAKKHFPTSSKKKVDDMVENIRKEFSQTLQELDWMDKKTRTRALTKADLLTPHIAYSEEILNDGLIEEFYAGLELGKNSYLKNTLKLKQWIFAYYNNEFRTPIDKQSWKTHGGAAIANAFYNAEENSMVFPAGILEGVFFNKDRPLYMNYGGIGVVIGHEIIHGFDDEGSQKDAEGSLVDWWEPETKRRYVEKTRCVINQYSNYTVKVGEETLNINGVNTQGENVADIGGVRQALHSYMKIVDR